MSKPLSDVNSRPGGDRKRKAPSPPSGTSANLQKPKLNMAPETEEAKKARRFKEDVTRANKMLADFPASNPGSAAPAGRTIGGWNRAQTVCLVAHIIGTNLTLRYDGLAAKFDLLFDLPSLKISNAANTHVLKLRPANFKARKNTVFTVAEYSVDLDPKVVCDAFKMQHRTSFFELASAGSLLEFGSPPAGTTDTDGTTNTIHCLTCDTTLEDSHFLWEKHPQVNVEGGSNKLLDGLMKDIRTNSLTITLVRRLKDIKPSVENYWKQRITTCVQKGVLNSYNKDIGYVSRKTFPGIHQGSHFEITGPTLVENLWGFEERQMCTQPLSKEPRKYSRI